MMTNRYAAIRQSRVVLKKVWFQMPMFIAFAVDRVALARYDLAATEMKTAEREAEQYLDEYPVIEVWSDDHRQVARLVRK